MGYVDGTAAGPVDVPQDAGSNDGASGILPDTGAMDLLPDADAGMGTAADVGMDAVVDVLPPVEGATLDMVYDIISDILGVLRDDGAETDPVELIGQVQTTLDTTLVVLHQVNACVFFIAMVMLYRMIKNGIRKVFGND